MDHLFFFFVLLASLVPFTHGQNSNSTSSNNGQGNGNGVNGNQGNGNGNVGSSNNSTANNFVAVSDPSSSTQAVKPSLTVNPVIPTKVPNYLPSKQASYNQNSEGYGKSPGKNYEEESTFGKTINVFNFDADDKAGLSYVEGYMKGNKGGYNDAAGYTDTPADYVSDDKSW